MSDRSAAQRALPYLLLLLLVLLMTWPTAATLGSHVVDRQDPLLNAWIMAWESHQLLAAPLDLFDSNIFVPHRNTLAFSELLLSTSLMVMPLQWLTGDALFSYNAAFLLSFLTTAVGSYLLALYLTGRRGAALVAAAAFSFAPYRWGHVSQIQLLALGWLPLALVYLDRILRERGEWRRNALLFSFFYLLQALTSFYYALFAALACALYVAGWLAWRRRLPRSALGALGLAALLVLALMLPLVWPYFTIQSELGAGWTLEQARLFSASAQAYGYAPPDSWLWGPVTAPLRYVYAPCCPPDTLFPGLTVLLLAAVAVGRPGGRRAHWLLLSGAGLLLSFGPELTIRAGEPTGIPLVYGWLWEHVPGFDALRAPVRWAVLPSLGLAMLAAVGVSRIGGRWAAPLALLLVLVEFGVAPLPLVSPPAAPPSQSWLAAQPVTRLLELPLVAERPGAVFDAADPRAAWRTSRLLEAQFFSTEHWHRSPDGYSGYVPSWHGAFAREMATFPSERAVALLQGLGVRYVVVHTVDLDEAARARLNGALPPALTEQPPLGTDRLFAIAGPLPPRTPTLRIASTSLSSSGGSTVSLALLVQGYYVPGQAEPLPVEVRWEREGEAHVERPTLALPPIVSRMALLDVPVTPPGSGEWNLEVDLLLPDGARVGSERSVHVDENPGPSAEFIPVELDGVRVDADGQIVLTWVAHAPLLRYYALSVRLLDESGTVVAAQDGPPGDPPTIAWAPGQPYTAAWRLDLPPDAALESLSLQLIWYDPERPSPVQLWNGEQFVDVLTP